MGTQVTMTAPQGGFPSLNEEESWQKGQRGGGWRGAGADHSKQSPEPGRVSEP